MGLDHGRMTARRPRRVHGRGWAAPQGRCDSVPTEAGSGIHVQFGAGGPVPGSHATVGVDLHAVAGARARAPGPDFDTGSRARMPALARVLTPPAAASNSVATLAAPHRAVAGPA
jgi:hypothetical protein